MTKLSKSVIYHFVWHLKSFPHYKLTKDGKIFNCRTMREIKRTFSGYTIGFNIQGKFYSISKLRTMIEKIRADDCPF